MALRAETRAQIMTSQRAMTEALRLSSSTWRAKRRRIFKGGLSGALVALLEWKAGRAGKASAGH